MEAESKRTQNSSSAQP